MAAPEKVTPLHENSAAYDDTAAQEIMDKAGKDMGKVAVFVSILAVILLVVFFFGLNQSLTGISAKVAELEQLSTQMAGFEARVAATEAGVANSIQVMEAGVNNKLNTMSTTMDGKFAEMESTMGTRIAGVEKKVTELADLPAKTKNMVMGTMMQEMAQTTMFLQSEVADPQQKALLEQAAALLQQVKGSLPQ